MSAILLIFSFASSLRENYHTYHAAAVDLKDDVNINILALAFWASCHSFDCHCTDIHVWICVDYMNKECSLGIRWVLSSPQFCETTVADFFCTLQEYMVVGSCLLVGWWSERASGCKSFIHALSDHHRVNCLSDGKRACPCMFVNSYCRCMAECVMCSPLTRVV